MRSTKSPTNSHANQSFPKVKAAPDDGKRRQHLQIHSGRDGGQAVTSDWSNWLAESRSHSAQIPSSWVEQNILCDVTKGRISLSGSLHNITTKTCVGSVLEDDAVALNPFQERRRLTKLKRHGSKQKAKRAVFWAVYRMKNPARLLSGINK